MYYVYILKSISFPEKIEYLILPAAP